MKVIIAGSRDFSDYKLLCKAIKASKFEITEVVSGDAKGADKLGEDWAIKSGLPVKKFPARWDAVNHPEADIKTNAWGKKYDRSAGFRRNQEMAEYADALIAIQVNESPGTQHMIKTAKEAGLEVFVYEDASQYEYLF